MFLPLTFLANYFPRIVLLYLVTPTPVYKKKRANVRNIRIYTCTVPSETMGHSSSSSSRNSRKFSTIFFFPDGRAGSVVASTKNTREISDGDAEKCAARLLGDRREKCRPRKRYLVGEGSSRNSQIDRCSVSPDTKRDSLLCIERARLRRLSIDPLRTRLFFFFFFLPVRLVK